jgi:hypothetical protein
VKMHSGVGRGPLYDTARMTVILCSKHVLFFFHTNLAMYVCSSPPAMEITTRPSASSRPNPKSPNPITPDPPSTPTPVGLLPPPEPNPHNRLRRPTLAPSLRAPKHPSQQVTSAVAVLAGQPATVGCAPHARPLNLPVGPDQGFIRRTCPALFGGLCFGFILHPEPDP